MKLLKYLDEQGQFDYDKYVAVQTAGNKRKLHLSWANEDSISFLAEWLARHISPLKFGLCHGTRRGLEQAWFREKLAIDVIGTEISDTACQFPHTVQWDFHEINPEWLGAADFIYSNSWDHAYDPRKCFDAWFKTLRPGGVCILEHSKWHTEDVVNELDPFGAHAHELIEFVLGVDPTIGLREVVAGLPPPRRHPKDVSHLIFQKRD